MVTSTSASFGIGFAVVSEPISAMRRTPWQTRASNTKRNTACSNGARGSATLPW